MSLVGKIFTVTILLMSLVVMSFAILVYETQKNWRDVVLNEKPSADKEIGLVHQLSQAKKEGENLKRERQEAVEEATALKAEKRQALAKSEEEKVTLKEENERLQKAHKDLVDGERKAAAAMLASQNSATEARKEAEALRADVRAANKTRDEQMSKVVSMTDELHQAVNELKRLKDLNTRLAADLGRAKRILDDNSLNLDSGPSNTPPRVEGLVLAMHGNDLVEISIGSDDGLQKGHRLEVFRVDGVSNPYLGRIEIMRTEPDKSVAKIDPNYRKGAIQKGDRVASKLE